MTSQGRVALVTGAGSGIGRAVARRLAAEGAAVAALDMNAAAAEATAGAIIAAGGRVLAVTADVSDAAQVRAASAQAAAALGGIDILVNNAGMFWTEAFEELTEARFQRMLAVHVLGAFHCAQVVVGGMQARGWGRIVNMASVAGLSGTHRTVAYSTAKAGLIGFTKSLARELGGSGITVNAVAPGFIDSPLTQVMGEARRAAAAERTLVGRAGTPEDIAHTVAYLDADEAGFITGQVISPNGGALL